MTAPSPVLAAMRRLPAAIALVLLLASPWKEALAQPAFVATVTADSADLRKTASAGGVRVGSLKKGEKVPAYGLSKNKEWVRVKGPDGAAWVSRRDVRVARGTVAAPPPPRRETNTRSTSGPGGPKRWATVTSSKTKVQLNATKSSPTVAVANRGDVFEVGGFSNNKEWVKVRTDDGRIGWIVKSDLRPGRQETARVEPPRERKRPDPEPPRRPRRASTGDGDMRVWADGGVLLFHQLVGSREGYGYDLNGMGFGGGVRFNRPFSENLHLEGGYLGTANQRITPPESNASLFSTLHRVDVSARYDYYFGGNPDGHKVFGLGGYQGYWFLVQPQNLSWVYSQIYHSLAVGAGAEGSLMGGTLKIGLDGRYFGPVLAGQMYLNGEKGGDGQANDSTGYAAGFWIRKEFGSGSWMGLGYRGHFYETKYKGEGKRGPYRIHEVNVKDEFQSVTFTYARGF